MKFEFDRSFACPVTKRKYSASDSGEFDPGYALRLESWKLGRIIQEPSGADPKEPVPVKPKPAAKSEPPKPKTREFKTWRGKRK